MSVVVLNESNFSQEVASGVTLVDFWAEWCGPCQMMLPILSDFANDMAGKMKVGKINVDENPSLAQQFRVMSIPTLIVLKDGKPVDMMVGVKTKEALKEAVEKHF